MTDHKGAPLAKALNPFHPWGIAVGLAISGEYFGPSHGWAQAGDPFLVFGAITAVAATADEGEIASG